MSPYFFQSLSAGVRPSWVMMARTVSLPASRMHCATSFQHARRLTIDLRLIDVSIFSHKPKFPEIAVHDWMIQFLPTSRQVDRIVSYDLSVEISSIPLSQSVFSPGILFSVLIAAINVVHMFLMSEHIALTVTSALTPKIDNARASKSVIVLFALSRHCVVNVVQDWLTCCSFASWASLICANASSINSSQTYVEMS